MRVGTAGLEEELSVSNTKGGLILAESHGYRLGRIEVLRDLRQGGLEDMIEGDID